LSKPEETRINNKITAQRIRLIGADGNNHGEVATSDALSIAEEAGLDLVEISPHSTPPVCKVMDYGKYKYEMQKKAREAHKKQKVIEIKEVKMRPVTDPHDLGIKVNNAKRFLGEGNKVKFSIMFRGRESEHKDIGYNLMQKIKDTLGEAAKIEQEPKFEGRSLTMMAGPAALGK
jgi:translation initiation factor IF-3